MRTLALLALLLVAWGCGGGEEDAQDLKLYVERLQTLDDLNLQVATTLMRLNEWGYEVTREDLANDRKLVDQYVDKVKAIEHPNYRDMLRAYKLHVRKLEQAKQQAVDKGKELKKERGNVAIALKEIRDLTIQHYNSAVDLLWLRQNLPGTQPLKWPTQEETAAEWQNQLGAKR